MQVSSREKQALQYAAELKERYQHHPEVKRIARQKYAKYGLCVEYNSDGAQIPNIQPTTAEILWNGRLLMYHEEEKHPYMVKYHSNFHILNPTLPTRTRGYQEGEVTYIIVKENHRYMVKY